MNARLAARRVEDGFANAPDDLKVAYLQELRTNWKDLEASITRKLFLLILVAIIGELAVADGIGAFTIAGVQLQNLTLVVLLSPILVAYLVFELAVAISVVDTYGEAHQKLIELTHPSLASANLEALLVPSGSVIWASPGVVWFDGYWALPRPLDISAPAAFWYVRAFAGLIAPPLFLIAYFSQLLGERRDWMVYSSLALCVVIVTVAAVQTASWLRHR